jgi:hypothetical protein
MTGTRPWRETSHLERAIETAGGHDALRRGQAHGEEDLVRRAIEAAAAWHASLDGEDAAVLAEFDATW